MPLIQTAGSPYRAALSQAVLKMQETNRLLILKKKWWQQMRGGGACKVFALFSYRNLSNLKKKQNKNKQRTKRAK